MKQTAICLFSLHRLAAGFGCLLALLTGNYAPAFAVSRAAISNLPELGHSRGNTSGFATAAAGAASRRLASPTAMTYTWTATGTSASWSVASNWTPVRNNPAPSDVLLFTSSSAAPTVVLDFVTSQTIASLSIGNSVAMTFSIDGTDGTGTVAGVTRTLNITNGNTGADLTLDAGATLTVYTSNATTNPGAYTGLTIVLGSGATATMGGHLVFDSATASSTGTSQVLQGSGTNAVEFTSGSVFTAQSGFRGNPFGSATASANSVVFRNGSRYEHLAGSTPFGAGSSAVASFEPASYYYYAPSTSTGASLSGRTYGNFEYNLTGTSTTSSGSNPVTFQGNLIVTNGTVNINVSGGINLQGNLIVNGGTFNLPPTAANSYTVQFNGTTAQTIGGTGGTLAFGANTTLQINNAAGVTLARPVSSPGALQLTSGLLTTSATGMLTLAAGATPPAGSATSFVNGPLRLTVGAVSTATSYNFPIGKGSAFRPLTLNVASQSSTTIYQAEQFEQDGGTTVTAPLQRVSRFRFFTVTPYNATTPGTVLQPSGFAGTFTLSFGTDDRVTNPAAATFVVAKRSDSSQPWATTGSSTGNTTTSSVSGPLGTFYTGTLTSASFTSFSDFILASTDADPTVNPLPVQLINFTATRLAKGGVALAWATASELNSARFEVERSRDGQAFEQVTIVAAQGSSAQAHEYAAQDAGAPLGQLYYRLRMVDVDGTAAYSPVATVTAGAASELTLVPNPVRDQLGIVAEATTAYTVRNALGQAVRTGTTRPGATTLDVSELPAGVYLFELHGSAGRVVRRFIKE